jgi:hypothetical protein
VARFRQNTKRAAAVLLALALAAGLFLFVKVYNETSKLPAVKGLKADPSSTPNPSPSKSRKPGTAADVSVFPTELTGKLGRRYHFPTGSVHVVRLEVTPRSSIGTLGYLVPTSDEAPVGSYHKISQPWSKTLDAVGTIYLAGIFIQNGTDANSVTTCRILIDGVVRNQETITGAYKRGLCIA